MNEETENNEVQDEQADNAAVPTSGAQSTADESSSTPPEAEQVTEALEDQDVGVEAQPSEDLPNNDQLETD